MVCFILLITEELLSEFVSRWCVRFSNYLDNRCCWCIIICWLQRFTIHQIIYCESGNNQRNIEPKSIITFWVAVKPFFNISRSNVSTAKFYRSYYSPFFQSWTCWRNTTFLYLIQTQYFLYFFSQCDTSYSYFYHSIVILSFLQAKKHNSSELHPGARPVSWRAKLLFLKITQQVIVHPSRNRLTEVARYYFSILLIQVIMQETEVEDYATAWLQIRSLYQLSYSCMCWRRTWTSAPVK